MILFLYNIAIQLFVFVFRILSLFNPKLKLRIQGLDQQQIQQFDFPTILFHCASAGDFEQLSTIIENFKLQNPNWRIVLSFFSPSGMNWIEKKKIEIEHLYLPFDTKKQMKEFISNLNPAAVVIAKNELWFNLFSELQKRNIPHYLIAASFKKNHFIFRFKSFLQILSKFNLIYTIDQDSHDRISDKLSNCKMNGDPRIDRIISKSRNSRTLNLFNRSTKPIIIYASLHKEDLFLLNGIQEDKDYLHIVVPHETDESEISFFKSFLGSEIDISSETKTWVKSIILVDEIGLLADIYQYSSFAYVGGGFGRGIHNILEPAIHKNNIFVGPNNTSFNEARILLKDEAIIEVSRQDTILNQVKSLNLNKQVQSKTKISAFFEANKGATNKITNAITKELNDIR